MSVSARALVKAARAGCLLTGIVGVGIAHASTASGAVPAAASTESTSAWFKTCRPHLEWVNWDRNLDIERYADTLVARARQINSDMLVYPWESGGYALYPTELAPPYEHLHGRDLIGMLERKAHAAGLRFGLCMLGQSGNTYLPSAHPEWVMRDRNDQPVGKWHGYQFRSLCPNSPYTNYLAAVASELLLRYRVDALYLEGIYLGSGFCRCEFCLESFRQNQGRELPKDGLEDDLDYQRYRQACFARPFQVLRGAIDAASPGTAFFGGLGYTYYFGKQGDDVRRVAPLVDVVCLEAQWNYDLPQGYDPSWAPPLPEVGLMIRQLRAAGGKPVLGTVWIAKHVDQNYAPRTPANVTLNFMELLAQGAIPQVHVQNALEVDATLLPTLSRLYRDAGELLPWMADSAPAAHVGLLDWATLDRPADFLDASLRGAYKAMLEAHLPVTLVTPAQISMTDCKVLVLANARVMDDATIAAIEGFVHRGGGLVMTYQTILDNERLAELAGIHRIASVRKADGEFPLHTYYRVTEREGAWGVLVGGLRSLQGGFESVEPQAGTRVLGHMLGFDSDRRSDKHILQVTWPGEPMAPLATERRVGDARVVYIAPDLCAAARRYGDADSLAVLAAAVRAAASGPPPLVVENIPPSVEVTIHRGQRGVALVLVNQTSNQYLADPVRYVVPIHEARLTLDCGRKKVRSVRTVTGADLHWHQVDDRLNLTLPKLDDYEGILIEQ